MTLRDTAQLLDSVLEQIKPDQDCREMYESMILKAIRYARIRVDWFLLNAKEQLSLDESRTRAHDAFIDSCNALSRLMGQKSLDNSWRRHIGSNRGEIGDFACCVHAVLGLKAR